MPGVASGPEWLMTPMGWRHFLTGDRRAGAEAVRQWTNDETYLVLGSLSDDSDRRVLGSLRHADGYL